MNLQAKEVQLLEYRGHIRNWKKLCEILEVENGLPREEREKALILNGYRKWGEKLCNHFYGMFAFALKDQDKILAFRDHFGTKPFYYCVTEQKELLFGTFIRDILAKPEYRKELEEEILQNYLTMTYVGGEKTFFKGIKKLMPGHYLVFENGNLEIHSYWTPKFRPDDSKSLEEYAEEINDVMKEIMGEVEDEKADAFLSSGVDSSYILAMSKVKRVHTCGYEEEQFDESSLAEDTANILGRESKRLVITPEEYFGEVTRVCEGMEQPLGDASAVVFSIACRHVAEYAPVCYSGEGSDEFFGGYRMYGKAEQYKEHLQDFYVGNTMIMCETEKKELLLNYREDLRPVQLVSNTYKEIAEYDPLSKMMRIDMELWLEGDIYLNVDKMSAVNDLEVRMPFTDPRMFETASRIPPKYKVTEQMNKLAFRTAAGKVLPKEIAFRDKRGFSVPIRQWLTDSRYNKDVREKLSGESAGKFFHKEKLQEMFDAFLEGESDLWRKIWTIYMFLVWYEIYFA
ncbi:MAG: asparagine synthase (glutamine-hydrolyzing) [Eubacteriales bacterium]|nr:asparagine synthase (glutamine-hydrolyzing) [Eubacteriales bacterium]